MKFTLDIPAWFAVHLRDTILPDEIDHFSDIDDVPAACALGDLLKDLCAAIVDMSPPGPPSTYNLVETWVRDTNTIGPYMTYIEALEAAEKLLAGARSMSDIRIYDRGNGQLVHTIYKKKEIG